MPTCGCTRSRTGWSRPNEVNLDGIFGHLPNVAWTTAGPMHPDDAARLRPFLARDGIQVQGLDKFPRLLDYVTPPGVRIADASRVRLGAYLSPGTTVMHEGFVNFNAGTLGTSMVEGRISQGVVVGDGSDIGGGASIMGTLSGGGAHRVSIGARTLLGANAGIGISLGDDCVVEAGLYVTAGSKIVLADEPPRARRQPTDGQGRRALRRERHPVPPQLPHRRDRGRATGGCGRHPQRGTARVRSRHPANLSRCVAGQGSRMGDRMDKKLYERELMALQAKLVDMQAWVQALGRADRGDLRGAGCRGQGLHDQAGDRST